MLNLEILKIRNIPQAPAVCAGVRAQKLYNSNKSTNITMNIKRVFGSILTVLGIIGLIYAGFGFINHSIQTREMTVAVIIGIIFFFSGIGLVKNTKDSEG